MEKGDRRSKRHIRRRPSRKTVAGRVLFELRWIRRNDTWILPIIAFAAIGLVALALSFIRLWTVTPDWVTPKVKISLIDYAQSWALERSAAKSELENNTFQALAAWRKATANNPGKHQSILGVMRNLRINSPSIESGRLAPVYGNWFMQITQTNLESIVLYAELLEKNHQFSKALRLLSQTRDSSQWSSRQASSLSSIQLRCYFATDKFKAFMANWEQLPQDHKTNPSLELQALAAAALLDRSPKKIDQFQSTFESQVSRPQSREAEIQTLRTALRVFAGNGQSGRTKGILNKLKTSGSATLADHAKHWNALILSESQDEIIELSKNAPDPITEEETLGLIRLFQRANLSELAEQQTLAFLDSPWASPLLWMERGDQLIRAERWSELKQAGLSLQRKTAAQPLLAIANYWEGFAEDRLENQRAAIACFLKIAEYNAIPSVIAGRLATKVLDIGYSDIANAIVASIDGETSDSRRYWTLRCSEALKRKDLTSFHSYALQGFRSDPVFVPHINNLAAALLLKRSDPQQSLSLTRKLVESNDSILFRMNHAHALIQNQMFEKAETILDAVSKQPNLMNPIYSDYSFARFEIASARQNTARARHWHAHIKINEMLPEVRNWIDTSLSALQERDSTH